MVRLCKSVLWISLLLGVPSAAHANLITIRPNGYRLGTDLSTMFEGLTMSHVTNSPNSDGVNGRTVYDPIASGVYAIPSLHTNGELSVGGRSFYTGNYETCRTGVLSSTCLYDVLELVFAQPTDFVQINSRGWSDGAGFIAYDINGNRLGDSPFNNAYVSDVVRLGGGADGFAETLTLTRSQRDIARVVYAGMDGSATPTQITYRVPEPSTLLLLSVGALLIARKRSVRRKNGNR